MSQQQYEYPLPPPPPPAPRPSGTPPGSAGAAYGRGAHGLTSRPLSAHLPSITTAFLGTQGQFSSQASTPSPASGTRVSPNGPYAYSPAVPSALNPHTPGGLPPPTPIMEPYNPRQWSGRGQVSGSQMVFQQRHGAIPANTTQITGMEAAMPSPPPPYTPRTPEHAPRPTVVSPLVETVGYAASPVPESSSRNSPQVPMSPAFPPPPGQSSRHRERSASGLGGNKSFFSLSGLRGKQPVTSEQQLPAQASSVTQPALYTELRPPGSRRAASTGQMQSTGVMASSSSASHVAEREFSEQNWQASVPLPGPPPGPPPPPGTRSQSLNRPLGSGRSTPEASAEPQRVRRTAAVPSLAPVPPTPANWNEQDGQDVQVEMLQHVPQADQDYQPLRIDTGAHRESSLARRPAKRDTSAQGLRERRSRSKATRVTGEEESQPTDLVFSPQEGSISRRREHTRTVSGIIDPSSAKRLSSVMTPPYTPAVGKQAPNSAKQSVKVPGSASSDRPISHILHTPNDDVARMQAPLTPARPSSSASVRASPRLDAFALGAIERHRSFVEKEMMASTDEERLELFANFIVHESRIRRDRYNIAYNAMAGDILDLTRDMWRSYASKNSKRVATPSTSMSSINEPGLASWALDGQLASAHANMPSSASSMGDHTPATDTGSNSDAGEGNEARWTESFKPSLSPIPSMAVSTVHDGDSSRGRTASRWWESNSGGGSVGRPDRIEKSRRETKYMGVSLAALQASDADGTSQSSYPSTGDQPHTYGPDGYPPEKVGWHEANEFETPMATPHRPNSLMTSTPGIAPLDVSRLVTLPPPYPRHHPAVNNSHPLLAELRAEHRMLADVTEIQKVKDSYTDQSSDPRDQQDAVQQRRANLRMEIQSKIADGSMSFADAAKAEADFDMQEAERGKASARASFDAYEASVSHPLNALLTARLDQSNDSITRLRTELESARGINPNQAQEEGDEHPERLEKLTLLKWLFEAREQLHKEMFDLHAMRSDKYSEVILTPYRISKAQAKIDEATKFFKKDNMERQAVFAKESQKRFEELQTVMENNVSRGVEDQLSAFWDIAPGLLEVIQQIPSECPTFGVQIPLQEYEENPSYHEYPLQYLYTLLTHAEKSAYQFIESQTNLLCLLHEVRTATSKSRLRSMEIERETASPNDRHLHPGMEKTRREAEDSLTRDLKEKVTEVEAQWREALGDGLAETKERVSIWLEESGGFEEGLDE